MPQHPFAPPAGRLDWIQVDSSALAGNLLGDPARRNVAVYASVGCDASSGPYPLLVGLAGFTSSGPKKLAWKAFGESLPQRIDRLVAAEEMGPVILALPDCFTSLGGNQYVDSAALGRWEAFLIDEVLPAVESRFPVRPERAGRAVFGHSSGGYGALIHGMRHAGHWAAVACHSGDVNFDLLYRSEWPRTLDVLSRHDGDPARFVAHVHGERKIGGEQLHALMLLAMAATYDPDPETPFGIRLPVDPRTCELIDDRWQAWLRHDPLRMIEDEACQRNLRRLAGLFIDCGSRDQYGLHYGARALVRKLERLGIPHVYEEFDDDHSGIDYRLDRSLPFLYRALSG